MILKANNVLLVNNKENKKVKDIKKKFNVRNVAMYYQIASHFNFAKLAKLAFRYIERCFAFVKEHENFVELDLMLLRKMLASSELNVDSELEVVAAADKWVSYESEKRSKFAEDLLSKVRFSFVSDHAVHDIISSSSFGKVNSCVAMLKGVLQKNESIIQMETSRCCTQNMLNIILSGGYEHGNIINSTKQFNGKSLEFEKDLEPMKLHRKGHVSVYCRGAVYVFGGVDSEIIDIEPVKSVLKYSLVTKTWERVADMFDNSDCFCACAFTDQIYIMGGHKGHAYPLDCCTRFDTKNNSWTKVAGMNEPRSMAACATFQGRIVVSGGHNQQNRFGTSTVEAYDSASDAWSPMPSMVERRWMHASDAIRNKLFVVRGVSSSCEIFDSTCKHFVALKKPPILKKKPFLMASFKKVASVGNKFVLLGNRESIALCYDVEKDEWSEKHFEATRNLSSYSYAITPQLDF